MRMILEKWKIIKTSPTTKSSAVAQNKRAETAVDEVVLVAFLIISEKRRSGTSKLLKK